MIRKEFGDFILGWPSDDYVKLYHRLEALKKCSEFFTIDETNIIKEMIIEQKRLETLHRIGL